MKLTLVKIVFCAQARDDAHESLAAVTAAQQVPDPQRHRHRFDPRFRVDRGLSEREHARRDVGCGN